MPNSLFDMFQAQNAAGEPAGFGDALASRSNSLIGLGLGMLQPSRPLQGESTYGNMLQGYMGGAGLDARTAAEAARLRHQKQQDARQAAMDKFNMSMREREFARGGETPYQRMATDLARVAGTPEEQTVRDFYRNQLDAGPPQTREIFDPASGRNVIQEWDSRTKQYKTATTPTTAATGGDYSSPAAAAPTSGGQQQQPVLPPKKPLTAHEQTAIDEADKALIANQNAISNLQNAKQLSRKAASGPFALERGQAGSYLGGGMFGEGGKETVMLHNVIINNAIDQLKATFGGNPSEGERKILLEMQGSVNAPDEVRQEIFDRGIKLAEQRLELNRRRAQQIRSGTYYNPGSGPGSGSASAPSAGGAPERKTIGGKSYSKIGGQWFED